MSQLQTGRIKLNSSEIAKLEYKLGKEKQKGKNFFDFFYILERSEGRHISFENVVPQHFKLNSFGITFGPLTLTLPYSGSSGSWHSGKLIN